MEGENSNKLVSVRSYICGKHFLPPDPIRTVYPKTNKSSDTNPGLQTTKTEGKMFPAKEDFEEVLEMKKHKR